MIKLIASDVDGTLIKDSTPELYPELRAEIKRLKQKGILFCAASGRQYESIRSCFSGVEEDIAYIAENGAHIIYQGKNISVTSMNRDYVEILIRQLRKYRDTCDIIVSTPDGSLMESRNQAFIDLITYSYRNKFRLTEDLLAVNTDILKVAIYHPGSIRELGEKVLIPQWRDRLHTCMAGEEWVDFMDLSVDKGHALAFLQNYLGLLPNETMTFGDNNNDIGMMHAAGSSYAVENAREEVKRAARYLCPPYWEKGVYQVLKSL